MRTSGSSALLLFKKYRIVVFDLIIAAALAAIIITNALWSFEHQAQDALFQRFGILNGDIVIYGIDDKALERFGPIQGWSRQIYADAIAILNSGDTPPAVIAIDVIFTGESAGCVSGCGCSYFADENLAKAAANGSNVVLASLLEIGYDKDSLSLALVPIGHITPYEKLAAHTKYGFANGVFSEDNIIRETQLTEVLHGVKLYSFPYEIYSEYLGGNLDETVLRYVENNKYSYIPFTAKHDDYEMWSLTDLFADDYVPGHSAAIEDIMSPYFYPELYRNQIVLIGPYATGLQDSYYTSVSRGELMNGVEIHANVLQMLLEANFKQYAPLWVNFLIVIITLILAMALADRLDIRLVLVVFAALTAGYLYSAWYVYEKFGLLLTAIYPVFCIAVIYIYKLVLRFVLEAIEKAKIRGAFRKYVDPALVNKLIESGEANSDEVGVNKNIAVLFVDVRGFTPMTEALKGSPETVVEILNEYLELATTSVFENGGSVDKFIGDATMALFNGFVPLDDYVYKAVKTAYDIVEGAASVNASISEKYGVDVGFGVGVDCGDAIVGNLGPSFRKDYTAIGDVVNTAARLESNAKRSQALISSHTYELVKDRVIVEPIGAISLKGKAEPMEVYSVIGLKG